MINAILTLALCTAAGSTLLLRSEKKRSAHWRAAYERECRFYEDMKEEALRLAHGVDALYAMVDQTNPEDTIGEALTNAGLAVKRCVPVQPHHNGDNS